MKNMRLLRKGHQQPNFSLLKRENGKTEWILGLFLLQFVMVIIVFEMQLIRFRTLAEYLEDALAASGLASALVDIERYGEDNVLMISDPYVAYSIYKDSLTYNIGNAVDDVIIEKYLIYNVENETVEIIAVSDSGITNVYNGSLGAVTTPDGQEILTTGVYSEISFPVEGLFGISTRAQKGKLIEVNSTKMGEDDEELE